MRAGNITPSRIESEALYEVSLVFVIVVFLGNTGRDRTEIGCFLRSGTTSNLEPHIVIVKVLQESRTQCFGRFAEYGSDVCVCGVLCFFCFMGSASSTDPAIKTPDLSSRFTPASNDFGDSGNRV